MVLCYELILPQVPDAPEGLHVLIQFDLTPANPAQIVLTNEITTNGLIAGSDTDIETTRQGFSLEPLDQDYTEMLPLVDGATAITGHYEYVDTTEMARIRLIKMGITTGKMIRVPIPRNCRDRQLNFKHPPDFPPDGFGDGGGSGSYYSAP